ncbi:MAG: DUF2950 domain-containing protein [Alsobacter sp.]
MTARHRFRLAPLPAVVAVLFCGLGPVTGAHAQEGFASPEAAVAALVEASKAHDPARIERIFGPGSLPVLSSGDAAEDKRRLEAFVAAAGESMTLMPDGVAVQRLRIGAKGFDFPVPLRQTGNRWSFDLAAGREEIHDRTIGFNELSAIEACRAYVLAQREYVRIDRDGDDVQSYAQRIISTPGTRDGLYWPAETQSDRSPLDSRVTDVEAAKAVAGKAAPHLGYRFKILKAQGPAAPGGAYSYVINGRMIAGFALVAYPDRWGQTGIMTFICGQQGRIYQRDLGPGTAKVGAAMTRYNPNKSWTLVP